MTATPGRRTKRVLLAEWGDPRESHMAVVETASTLCGRDLPLPEHRRTIATGADVDERTASCALCRDVVEAVIAACVEIVE